jgi:diguanylate cyclase (GGDEF)-like protein
MPDRELINFIQVVGVTAQVSATVLIAAFFMVLRLPGQRHPYFHFWRAAWVCLVLALLALVPQVNAPGGAQIPLSYGLYHVGKLLFLLFLLSGVLAYTRGFNRRLVWRFGLPLTIAYALASFLFSPNFSQVMRWQFPLAVAAFGWASVLLLGLPAPRRTLGSRLTGMAMLLSAMLWLANAVYTVSPAIGMGASPHAWLSVFTSRYGSFADLILQVLMSFGMVVIIFEDTGREMAEAYKRLAISYRHLERAAYIDPLTGALTRRAFHEGVGMAVAGTNYGVLAIIDLDDLKAVNDSRGHTVGDGLLRHCVEALRARLRPLDQIYRWGGDEFVVVMVQTTLAEAGARLVRLLGELPGFESPPLPPIAVRLSHGLASFRSSRDMPQALVAADRAMLEEKQRRKGGARAPR